MIMQPNSFAQIAVSVMTLAGLLTASAAVLADRAEIGTVTRAQNEVRAEYRREARTLRADAAVLFEDFLTTGEAARLEAQLKDGTKITLGEYAEMMLDEFVYDPSTQTGGLTMRVVEGAFLFIGGKVEEMAKSEVTIMTPVAVLGIRGTTVWGGPIDGGYGVLVLDGEVEVRTAAGRVSLGANQATMIYGDDRPADPHAWAKEKIDRAVATISFTGN
jgi:hypothetical protein